MLKELFILLMYVRHTRKGFTQLIFILSYGEAHASSNCGGKTTSSSYQCLTCYIILGINSVSTIDKHGIVMYFSRVGINKNYL